MSRLNNRCGDPRMGVRLAAGAGLALLALNLGGCGKLGVLEQPAPLYGRQAQEDYNAEQAARAAAARQRDAQRQNAAKPAAEQPDPVNDAPPSPRDIQSPDQQLTPAREDPIAGVPDPVGPPPSLRPPGA